MNFCCSMTPCFYKTHCQSVPHNHTSVFPTFILPTQCKRMAWFKAYRRMACCLKNISVLSYKYKNISVLSYKYKYQEFLSRLILDWFSTSCNTFLVDRPNYSYLIYSLMFTKIEFSFFHHGCWCQQQKMSFLIFHPGLFK